jgi:hypothetical protein
MSKMTSSSQKWIQIRRELYHHVRKNVLHLLGPMSDGLKRYDTEYAQELKKKWQASHRLELLSAIEKSQLVWIGDFHALKQSQKAQLRILKSLAQKEDLLVFVECIEAKNQKFIDLYLSGKINEREFLKAIEWKKSWGFPWENFKPLFRWAAKNKVQVVGANLHVEDRSAQSLRRRDVFSSQVIADVIKKNRYGKRFVVIYGDLHLASKHLPAELSKRVKNLKSVYVYQNPEEVYFQLLEKDIEHQVDVVKFGGNKFALNSVPPWVKWQNYLIYLESQFDKAVDDELDLTDYVAKLVRVIGSDLGVDVKVDHFEVVTAQDIRWINRLKAAVSEKEFYVYEYWIEFGRSFFEPQTGFAYLGGRSVNSASQLAMAIVLASLAHCERVPSQFPKQFVNLIWIESAYYFGTKLVNPKRKTDTLADIKASLAARSSDEGKEALQLALSQKMLELLYVGEGRRQRELLRPRRFNSYLEAARILGGILGEKLFFGYRKKMLSQRSLLQLLQKPVESPQFANIYWEILELIESLPEPFKSKKEKI